ncbi:MAG: hypothetical protein QGF36_00700 [Candidatus Marinimicrobia bacterium]|nr:hypothetical protein [Candidatus Neomarinimicrobiota bacterium]MDP6935926.1 hypothetical protein [Candidatus Neomarinimicrobiota bacterium]
MKIKGRGNDKNPQNRLESVATISEESFNYEPSLTKTKFMPDYSKSIIR